MAGAFAGAGALVLLFQGETTAGIAILGSMMGFFIGDQNGQKETEKKLAKLLEHEDVN
jgi:hypothetical protein